MSQEENRESVFCCVMNCQKKILVKNAITIEGNYFCKNCGTAYYRSKLNL